MVWPQMDKPSSAWLLTYQGPHTGISAMESHICRPSPACRDRVGEKVCKAVVDLHGDKLMATTLQGDTWRIKHETVKSELNRLCVWSSNM